MLRYSINKVLPALVVLLMIAAALMPAVGGDSRAGTDFGGMWYFDEGSGSIAIDYGDYGNNGNINGATWVDGVMSTGLSFDGDDYVLVPDDDNLEAGGEEWTISLWFKTSSTADQMLISKWNLTYHGFMLRLNANSTISYLISDGTNQSGNSTHVAYADDEWHNIMVTRDPFYEELILYYDGNDLDTSEDKTGDLADTTGPLTIGKPSWSTTEGFFVGSMDEVIFDYGAMSSFSVMYYYYMVSAWLDTVGFWPYDEDLGTTVEDYSANDNDGTSMGGLSYVEGVDYMCGRFDGGSGHYTEVSYNPSLDFEGSFTVLMWVRTEETGQAQDLVTKYSTSSPNTGFYTRLNPSSGSQGQTGAFVFSVNPNQAYRASSVSVADGEWHYCVGVYNMTAGKMDVYIDGELKNGPMQGSVPSSVSTNSQPIQMGKGYKGDMDEVRIYSRAMTADEIMVQYLIYDIARPPSIEDLGEFTALEDQDSVFYLASYLSDPDTPLEYLDVWTDSDNCTVSGQELHFLYETGGFDETVTVYVSDYDATVDAELLVHVQEVNDAPMISGIPTQRIKEDEVAVIDLSNYLSDEETDLENLTLWCEHPDLMEMTGFCLTFFFPSPVERQRVNISLYDGGTFSYGYFNLDVSAVNDPPVIIKLGELVPPLEIVLDEGTTQWFNITVEDEDDDTFEYELETEWAGFTVFENGTLRVSAAKGKIGDFNGTLTVSDFGGETATVDLNVTVANVNDPPSIPIITSPINGSIYTKGDQVNFTLTVTDPDLPLGDTLTVTWGSDLAGQLASLTLGEDPDFNTTELAPGEHLITLTVTDGTFSQEAKVTITVKKAPSATSEGFLSGSTAWAAVIGLIILVVVGVIILLMVMRKRTDTAPAPPGEMPVADGPPSFPPPPSEAAQGPGDVVVDASGPPAGPPTAGAPPAGAPPAGVIPAGASPAVGPAAAAATAVPAPTHQAAPAAGPEGAGYIVPPAPGTWDKKAFKSADLKFPGPPVELPTGDEGQIAHATGVFQANPQLTPITLKKMDDAIAPEVKAEEAELKADRETEILALTNTILRIPGGLNRRLMAYDMWDLAEKIVDGERSTAPNGRPVVTIDGNRYYNDPADLGTFLSEVDGDEAEDEGPKTKKKPSKKAKKDEAGRSDEEKRQEMLDKLDQRLIDGDISEETYERLRKKYGEG